MLKRKTNIFVTILFTFVAFTLIGTTNINAATDSLNEVVDGYTSIEIIKKEGFDVSDVTLRETYGYETATPKGIEIKNISANDLKVKSVAVSDDKKFEVVTVSATPTLATGAADSASYTIRARTGLNTGTYTGTITVTDENDKTYTSTVTLKVERKPLGEISVSQSGWTYGDIDVPGYTKSGLDFVTSDKYTIEYSKKGVNSWSNVKPKLAGEYTIRLTITDSNLEEKSVESDFTIEKNAKPIQIIANSNEWTYDGNSHSDSGYTVKYDGVEATGGVLSTGDIVTAVIRGFVTDVKDNVETNNAVDSFIIKDSDGNDVTDCYKSKTITGGTVKINPITTPIIVTADSDTKPYTGSALTKNTYTSNDEVLLPGDTLDVTITGSQTYAGQSENKVESVKVMRGSEDITSNYTFGTHNNGTLKVTAIDQPLEIADQYIITNAKLLTSELKQALTGAKGMVSFEKKSGTAGEYNSETIGGFLAGSFAGDVIMTVRATSFNAGGDETPEYNETTKDFIVHVVEKQTVTISGIENNQELTYDGTAKTPQGTIIVTDNKVDTSTLEVSYKGIDGTEYTSTTAPTEVGTYTVIYKVPDDNATYVGAATFTFKIAKIKLSVTFEKTTYKYTGEDMPIEFPKSFDFDLMYLTSTTWLGGEVAPILKRAGTFNYHIALKDKNHYEWSNTTADYLLLTLYVEETTPTIEISNLSQKVGNVVAPTYTVTPAVTDGTVKIEYKLSTVEDTEYTETLPTEAGTYLIRVSVTRDKNLKDTSKVETLKITKKTTGGGSSTTTYAITAKENENAEITPNGTVKVEKGSDKTFSIKAKEGYEIEDVLVDGKSVGAVSKYTFENVKAKHTLEVKAKKAEIEEKPTTLEVKETFKDVKKDAWYFEAVEYVAKKGLMNGTGNDEFSPNATTTRGMIVTILYRLEGEPAVEECSFTDVSSDAYYAKAIAWAEKNSIVLGLGECKFGPNQEITREQLATIMYRYSMYKKYDTSVGEDTNILSYNDIQDLAEYAFTAMQYACGDGLISGMGNGNLEPKGNATRAQVATILMRYCEKYMK